MDVILLLIIIIVVAAVIGYFVTRKTRLERRAHKNTYEKVLPSGITIWIENGEPYPSTAVLETVVIEFIEQAHDRGYRLQRNEMVIAFLKPDGVSDTGLPIFEINSDDYRKSRYDNNGTMKIAGQYFPPSLIVLPTQRDDGELREILRHELLHLCLAKYDPDRYDDTKIHVPGEEFTL